MNRLRELFDEEKVNEVYRSWIDLAKKEHRCSVCDHYIRTFFCNGSEEYECELSGEKFPDKKECDDWKNRCFLIPGRRKNE